MLVRDAMTPDPVTATRSTTLRAVATTLADLHVSALPVVDEEHVVIGVVSEADLLEEAFQPDRRSHLIPPADQEPGADVGVAAVITSPAVTVHAATDVVDVVTLMRAHGYKSLPVVDDAGRLIGMVSRSDLVRFRTRKDKDILDAVLAVFRELQRPDWLVDVAAGAVVITGPGTAGDRAMAEASAATVAGVVRVTTRPT